MPIRTLIIVLLALTALSGCGRRGLLESAPPAPVVAPTTIDGQAQTLAPAPPIPPAEPAARSFFLDFLL